MLMLSVGMHENRMLYIIKQLQAANEKLRAELRARQDHNDKRTDK